MFTYISWANYLVVITLLLAAYYTIIGIRFYSYELQHLLSGLRKLTLPLTADKVSYASENKFTSSDFKNMEAEPFGSENLSEPPSNYSFPEVDQLTSQIQAALTEAACDLFSREAFVQLLRQMLRTHPTLNDSPFKPTIQELIISECEKKGTIQLSKEELTEVWRDVYR